jgi:hypothetical protein
MYLCQAQRRGKIALSFFVYRNGANVLAEIPPDTSKSPNYAFKNPQFFKSWIWIEKIGFNIFHMNAHGKLNFFLTCNFLNTQSSYIWAYGVLCLWYTREDKIKETYILSVSISKSAIQLFYFIFSKNIFCAA